MFLRCCFLLGLRYSAHSHSSSRTANMSDDPFDNLLLFQAVGCKALEACGEHLCTFEDGDDCEALARTFTNCFQRKDAQAGDWVCYIERKAAGDNTTQTDPPLLAMVSCKWLVTTLQKKFELQLEQGADGVKRTRVYVDDRSASPNGSSNFSGLSTNTMKGRLHPVLAHDRLLSVRHITGFFVLQRIVAWLGMLLTQTLATCRCGHGCS
jgi:hypothetical protein